MQKSSSVHGDKRNDILILGTGPTQALHDPTLTSEAEYSVSFNEEQKKFCLSLHLKAH